MTLPASEQVGVIGLGAMGKPMARRILSAAPVSAGKVNITARNRDKVEDLIDEGATWFDSPRELAASSTIVLLMLPAMVDILSVIEGPDGVLAGAANDTVLVISSTISPEEVRDLGARLMQDPARSISVVDAPVSGGEEGAIAGTLAIMVGGGESATARALPVLRVLGNAVPLGQLGAGQVAKACNQMIVAATMLALGEAFVVAERAGLDISRLIPLLSGGSAGSYALSTKGERFITRDYGTSGPSKYLAKDLVFAWEEAQRTQTSATQLHTVFGAFVDLVDSGFGDLDTSAVQAYVASRPVL